MSSGENEFIIRFHAIFSLIAAFALRKCLQQTHSETTVSIGSNNDGKNACDNVGNTVFLLVAAWHLVIFLRCFLQYPQLLSYYRFLLPLSLWFALPDWFLVEFAKTLEFPRNGSFWMIGNDAVSPCMAGMWSIPGLLILHSCYPAATDNDENRLTAFHYAKAAVVGMIVFGMAEQFLPFLWTPTEHVVHRAGWGSEGIAMYVLPAETLLGPMILYSYHKTKDGANWYQPVIGAGMTTLMYTGALSIGLLAIEFAPCTSITT